MVNPQHLSLETGRFDRPVCFQTRLTRFDASNGQDRQ